MKTIRLVVLALALSAAIGGRAPAEEFALDYHFSAAPGTAGIETTSRQTTALPNLLEGAGIPAMLPVGASLPVDAGSTPVFAKWETPRAPQGFVLLAATKSREAGQYDRVFVDANCDGNLADESPLAAIQQGFVYGPVAVTFPGSTGGKYHMTVRVSTGYYSGYGMKAVTSLSVEPACWYEGKVTLDRHAYKVALIDHNANGLFDDTSMDLGNADEIAVGEEAPATLTYRCVGKYIQIGGKLYHPRPARTGSKVEFIAAEAPPTGVLRVTGAATSITLAGENGEVTCDLADGKARFPVGKWVPKSWVLIRKDAEGMAWRLGGSAFPANLVFEIVESKDTTLDIGEPFNARVAWAGYSEGVAGQEAKPVFTLRMAGRMGEAIGIVRGDAGSPAPRLHIRNVDGDYDEKIAFEYG